MVEGVEESSESFFDKNMRSFNARVKEMSKYPLEAVVNNIYDYWTVFIQYNDGYIVPIFPRINSRYPKGALGYNCLSYGILNNILLVGLTLAGHEPYKPHGGILSSRISLFQHDLQHASDIWRKLDLDSLKNSSELIVEMIKKNTEDNSINKNYKDLLFILFFCLHECPTKNNLNFTKDLFQEKIIQHLIRKDSLDKQFSKYSPEFKILLDMFEVIDIIRYLKFKNSDFKEKFEKECPFIFFNKGLISFKDPEKEETVNKIDTFIMQNVIPKMVLMYEELKNFIENK